jgi:hypothetical protein
MRPSNSEATRFSGLPWSLISVAPALAAVCAWDWIVALAAPNGFIDESKLNYGVIAGWAGAILLMAIELAHPAFIEVGKDAVAFKGHFFWSQPGVLQYRDILRFEYRRYGRGRENCNLWIIVAVMRPGSPRKRVTLPVFGRKPFARLKWSLAEWQTAHGCLEPTPFADFSEDVRV